MMLTTLRRLLLVLLALTLPTWANPAPADWRVLTATAIAIATGSIVGGATGGLIAGQGSPFTANKFTHALLNRRSKLSIDGKGAS
jgi:hypothetical protein